MAVRPTMANIISRLRTLVNDPSGASEIWTDQTIQDVLDERDTRLDLRYLALAPAPTYTGNTIYYYDYFSDLGDWEDDITFWQWRINQFTPVVSENIVGHWNFSQTVLPPVYCIGKTFDIYRAAANLLERQAAQWSLSFDFSADGQSFRRSQAALALRNLAMQYRQQQRPTTINLLRTDLVDKAGNNSLGLGPLPIDYMGDGSGR